MSFYIWETPSDDGIGEKTAQDDLKEIKENHELACHQSSAFQWVPKFVAAKLVTRIRKMKFPVRYEGKWVEEYPAHDVTEYMCLQTGEIIAATKIKANPLEPKPYHYFEFFSWRNHILSGLRKEVRDFAKFILEFRNDWGGLTPNMEVLVHWYAKLNDRRPQDVRRNVKRLEAAGICNGDTVLAPFQKSSSKATKDRIRSALGNATSKFEIMFLKRHWGPSPFPVWPGYHDPQPTDGGLEALR